MNLISYALLIILTFICVFALVDRICKCIEHHATAKAFAIFMSNGGKKEDFIVGFQNKNS